MGKAQRNSRFPPHAKTPSLFTGPVSGLTRLDASPSHGRTCKKRTPDGHSGRESVRFPFDTPTLAYRCGGSTGLGKPRITQKNYCVMRLPSPDFPFDPGQYCGRSTSERARSVHLPFSRNVIQVSLMPRKEMLNNIQCTFLAVDFSELFNIVSAWKPRLTASTKRSVSWHYCAKSCAPTIHSCDSNSCPSGMKTSD